MAKVTGRTTSVGLDREASPQKHLANYVDESRNKDDFSDMCTVMRLTRDAALEKLQIRTASLMRLNAVWGLESKPDPVKMGKCPLNFESKGDPDIHFPKFGVQFNTKHELNLFCDG